MKDLLFLGMWSSRTIPYTVDRALAGPYRNRVAVVYVEEFIRNGSVELSPDREPVLRWGHEEIRFERIRACYNVLMALPRQVVQQGLIREGDWHACRSRLSALILALHQTQCLVINRPLLDGGNGSKPLQTFDLARHGFRVPRSLTTNSPDEALAFAEALQWRVIYKSTSSRTSIVKRLTPDRRADLAKIRACPILLQEQIQGPDVRAHFVGDEAFAERIDFTGGVDARLVERGLRQFRAIDLPASVHERCVSFMRTTGLRLVGFDFKLCPETGDYVVLEANPLPGYDLYDGRLEGRISTAIIRLMAEGRGGITSSARSA